MTTYSSIDGRDSYCLIFRSRSSPRLGLTISMTSFGENDIGGCDVIFVTRHCDVRYTIAIPDLGANVKMQR